MSAELYYMLGVATGVIGILLWDLAFPPRNAALTRSLRELSDRVQDATDDVVSLRWGVRRRLRRDH